MHKAILISLLAGASLLAHAAPTNPYAGQQTREIKALSADEMQGYLSGKGKGKGKGMGMGLARAAELNGYPGPAHVKALATDLGLSTQQSQQTDELFARMASQSAELGRQLVEEERALDALFASRKITLPGVSSPHAAHWILVIDAGQRDLDRGVLCPVCHGAAPVWRGVAAGHMNNMQGYRPHG